MRDPAELLERIWERDPTVWTGTDEAHWLGWLDRRSSDRRQAPEEAGSDAFPIIEPAPGRYVARRLG